MSRRLCTGGHASSCSTWHPSSDVFGFASSIPSCGAAAYPLVLREAEGASSPILCPASDSCLSTSAPVFCPSGRCTSGCRVSGCPAQGTTTSPLCRPTQAQQDPMMTLALALVTALSGEHHNPLLDPACNPGSTSGLRGAAARETSTSAGALLEPCWGEHVARGGASWVHLLSRWREHFCPCGNNWEAAGTLSLQLVSLEQASMDAGSMELSHLADRSSPLPCSTADRASRLSGNSRAWQIRNGVTAALAYLEGMDTVTLRRSQWRVAAPRRRPCRQGAQQQYFSRRRSAPSARCKSESSEEVTPPRLALPHHEALPLLSLQVGST